MRAIICLLSFLLLWREADGFVAAPRGSAQCLRRSSGSHTLSVSTQTEEELRDKLARDNEDLSEVSTAALGAFDSLQQQGFGFLLSPPRLFERLALWFVVRSSSSFRESPQHMFFLFCEGRS